MSNLKYSQEVNGNMNKFEYFIGDLLRREL